MVPNECATTILGPAGRGHNTLTHAQKSAAAGGTIPNFVRGPVNEYRNANGQQAITVPRDERVDQKPKKSIKGKKGAGGVSELVLNKSASSNGVVINTSYQNSQKNSMTNRE